MKKIIALIMTALTAAAFVACSQPVEIKPIVDEPTEIIEPNIEEKTEFVVDAQLIENILDGYYGNGQTRLDKLAEEGFSEEEIAIITAEVSRVCKERHPEK